MATQPAIVRPSRMMSATAPPATLETKWTRSRQLARKTEPTMRLRRPRRISWPNSRRLIAALVVKYLRTASSTPATRSAGAGLASWITSSRSPPDGSSRAQLMMYSSASASRSRSTKGEGSIELKSCASSRRRSMMAVFGGASMDTRYPSGGRASKNGPPGGPGRLVLGAGPQRLPGAALCHPVVTMDAIGPPQTKKFAAMPYKPQAARNLSKPPDDSERFLPPAGWLGDAGSRIANRWVIKMAGTTAIMTAFFAVYFYLLNHSRLPVTTVPRIFVDRMIAFRPGALPLYVSLWVYVPLAPALFRYTSEMRAYTVAVLVLSAIGFGIFILWPTTIPKPEFDQAPVPSLAYLKAVDASGNAFPSLHVAFAVFTVFLF